MKKRLISAGIAGLLIFVTIACGRKASTPTQAFNSFYESSKAKDVPALKRLVAKETLTSWQEAATGSRTSLDEVVLKETQSGIPDVLPETRNEKIDGAKATLEFNYKRGEKDNWRALSLVKEDGEWKVIFK